MTSPPGEHGISDIPTPPPLEPVPSRRYRTEMKNNFILVLWGLAAFVAQPAMAHPHVWVTGAASFQFENTKLTSVGMRWQFDAFFSQVLGADFDTNADGTFDAIETQAMKDQVFTSLKDFGYFTHLRTETSDTEQVFKQVDNFAIGDDDGEMVFSFDLILAEPLDPATEAVGLSLYDPTIYVDLILGGDTPVEMAGADGLGCAFEFRRGNEITSQSFFLMPQEVWLSCSGS